MIHIRSAEPADAAQWIALRAALWRGEDYPLLSEGSEHGDWRLTCKSMERIEAGRAHCALCGEAIRVDEDALVTPDFLADEGDPFWRFSDAPMHRACFLVWDRRKAFVARYNGVVRQWLEPDGSHPHMTSEGEVVKRSGSPPPSGPAT